MLLLLLLPRLLLTLLSLQIYGRFSLLLLLFLPLSCFISCSTSIDVTFTCSFFRRHAANYAIFGVLGQRIGVVEIFQHHVDGIY